MSNVNFDHWYSEGADFPYSNLSPKNVTRSKAQKLQTYSLNVWKTLKALTQQIEKEQISNIEGKGISNRYSNPTMQNNIVNAD